jgi:hypothetical protein
MEEPPVFTREQLLEIRSKHYANEQKVYLDKLMKNVLRDVKEVAKTELRFHKTYYINHKLFASIPDLYDRLYSCFPDSYVTMKATDDNTLFREKMKAVHIKIDWATANKSVNIESILEMLDSHADQAVDLELVQAVEPEAEPIAEPIAELVAQATAQATKKKHKPSGKNNI